MQKAKVFFEEFLNKVSSGAILVEKNARKAELKKTTKKEEIVKLKQKEVETENTIKNIQVVLQIKKKWGQMLAKKLNTEATRRLCKYTKPAYIENNILYVQVSQSDEQFFLTMNQKKILEGFKNSKNEFLYPEVIQRLTQIVTTYYIT